MFYFLKYLDLIIMAAYLIVAIFNSRSLIMVFLAVNYYLHFYIKVSNFQLFYFMAFYQFLTSITNINISSSFRKALFLQGVIYVISAINEVIVYKAGIRTNWPYVMPIMITWLDLYIISILLRTRRYGRKRPARMPAVLVYSSVIRLLCNQANKAIDTGRNRTWRRIKLFGLK